jgi:hypothetical protein
MIDAMTASCCAPKAVLPSRFAVLAAVEELADAHGVVAISQLAPYMGVDLDAVDAAVESLLCHGELRLVDDDHVAVVVDGHAPSDPVAHLSTESLNARARKAAATVAQASISLRNNEALAFEAARLGCAHLDHVELLEAAARRAVRRMVRRPVIRLL